jgi:acetyl esterase
VSPLLAERLDDLSPALLLTAEFDPLRDEGELYADALRKAGVDVTAKRFDGTIHVFMMFSPLECAQQSDAMVFDFVNRVAS